MPSRGERLILRIDMESSDSDLAQVLAKYARLVDWERRNRSAMKVDIEPLRDLLHQLDNPQKEFRTIHIAGTKGKGSVGALIEAGLHRAGLACGRFSSPHVERITERVTFGGQEISESVLARLMNWAWLLRERTSLNSEPGGNTTRFDLETLAAILAFVEAKVNWAVIECGLGGRTDSTNVIDGEVCVLTNVELEHTAVLGSSHSAIAFQKVGILKRGATMVTGIAPDSAAGQVVSAEAHKLDCPVVFCSPRPGETIAEINTRLAQNALDEIGRRSVSAQDPQFSNRPIGGWLLDEATQWKAGLPGRLEGFELPVSGGITGFRDSKRIPVILDGAHVPFNLAAVLRDLHRIRELAGFFAVVFGTGRDKQAFAMLELLKVNRVDAVICTQAGSDVQSWTSHELCHFAGELGLSTQDVSEPRDALMQALALVAGRGWILVTGSLRLVGEIRPISRGLGAEQRRFPSAEKSVE
jgi:dihydrofolate synthase/folylpolyglutamate synthase